MFFVTASMGRGTPITPVDPTKTFEAEMPNALAVRRAVDWAWTSHSFPVKALALPLFTRMAWALPDFICRRPRMTGAAGSWFLVKTPAMGPGTSDAIKARSG